MVSTRFYAKKKIKDIDNLHLNTIKKVKLELKSMLNYNSKLTNVVLDKPAFILISYCYWIISMSNRMKIKKLYFLARDGQILKKISEILIKKLNYNIKCEYLYVSRQSLRICNLDLNNETDLKWLLKNSKDVPLTKDLLLKRLALSMTDILNSKFNQYKIDNTSPKKQFKAFLKDSTVRKIINEHVKKERKIALEYFEKKGLFNSENYAFVDVGWQGRIPIMLRNMLDKSQLQFFYMGNLNPNKVFDIQIYSWLFDNENHLERTSFFDNTCATDLLEVITSVKKFLDSSFNKNLINMLAKDITATNIYTIGYKNNSQSNLDYTNKIIRTNRKALNLC